MGAPLILLALHFRALSPVQSWGRFLKEVGQEQGLKEKGLDLEKGAGGRWLGRDKALRWAGVLPLR